MQDLIENHQGMSRVYILGVEHSCFCEICSQCKERIHPLYEAIKVGITRQKLKKRLGDIQTGNPKDFVVLKVILADAETEKSIQERWRRFNISGEWYKPAPEILTEAISLPMFPKSFQNVSFQKAQQLLWD